MKSLTLGFRWPAGRSWIPLRSSSVFAEVSTLNSSEVSACLTLVTCANWQAVTLIGIDCWTLAEAELWQNMKVKTWFAQLWCFRPCTFEKEADTPHVTGWDGSCDVFLHHFGVTSLSVCQGQMPFRSWFWSKLFAARNVTAGGVALLEQCRCLRHLVDPHGSREFEWCGIATNVRWKVDSCGLYL